MIYIIHINGGSSVKKLSAWRPEFARFGETKVALVGEVAMFEPLDPGSAL